LANEHFKPSNDERKVFEEFFENVRNGTMIRLPSNAFDDVEKGYQWGIERTIKAGWIVWLCKDPLASKKFTPSGKDPVGKTKARL
jgi:hypothetical protein